MPKLPQAADYGARPSLRVNRIDRPADMTAVATAVESSAQKFAAIYGQQKAKRDALNYNLAKQEFLKADIQERQALQDREDYEVFDDEYREKIGARRSEILERYNLAPDDTALFAAETDLITEQSSVKVQAYSQEVMRDNKRAQIDTNLLEAREEVLNTDPESANRMMLNMIESLRDAEREGIYDDEEVLVKIRSFVTDVSKGRLMSMEVDDRIREIELALAYRDARGAFELKDLESGERGSGSIGDFLHRDELVEMLRSAQGEAEANDIQAEVYGIIDAVSDEYRGVTAQDFAKQKAAARTMLDKNDPLYGKKRRFLEDELNQRQAESARIDNMVQAESERRIMSKIEAGEAAESLSGLWGSLSEARKSALKRYEKNWRENNGFAVATDPEKFYGWYQMTPEQKIAEDLNTVDWKNALDRADWDRFVREQNAYADAAASGTNKDPNLYRGDPDDEVLRNMLVGSHGVFKELPEPGDSEYEVYRRIDLEINRRLTDASLEKYMDPKIRSGYLSPQEVHQITSDALTEIVFLRRKDFGIDWLDTDEERRAVGLSEEEKTSGDVYGKTIDDIRKIPAKPDTLGRPQNMEDYLRGIAGTNSENLSGDDIEHIFYLWQNGYIDQATKLLEGRD